MALPISHPPFVYLGTKYLRKAGDLSTTLQAVFSANVAVEYKSGDGPRHEYLASASPFLEKEAEKASFGEGHV